MRAGPMVAGGLFIGLWLYPVFFRLREFVYIDTGAWLFWGFVGLAVAGGLYASRVANVGARIAIWVTLGVALGFLAMFLVFKQTGEAVAAIFTAAGAGLIVTGLPGGWSMQQGEPAAGWQDANQPR